MSPALEGRFFTISTTWEAEIVEWLLVLSFLTMLSLGARWEWMLVTGETYWWLAPPYPTWLSLLTQGEGSVSYWTLLILSWWENQNAACLSQIGSERSDRGQRCLGGAVSTSWFSVWQELEGLCPLVLLDGQRGIRACHLLPCFHAEIGEWKPNLSCVCWNFRGHSSGEFFSIPILDTVGCDTDLKNREKNRLSMEIFSSVPVFR